MIYTDDTHYTFEILCFTEGPLDDMATNNEVLSGDLHDNAIKSIAFQYPVALVVGWSKAGMLLKRHGQPLILSLSHEGSSHRCSLFSPT